MEERVPRGVVVDDRKIFVGGLTSDITEEDLATYFGQYGKVECSEVKRNAAGTPRGFGFVTFQSSAPYEVIRTIDHSIRNVPIDPKPLENRPVARKSVFLNKVFIGGVDRYENDETVIRTLNDAANVNVVNLEWPTNHGDPTSRKNYLFAELASQEERDRALSLNHILIGNKQADIKPVEKRESRLPRRTILPAIPNYGMRYTGIAYSDAMQMQQWQSYMQAVANQQIYNNSCAGQQAQNAPASYVPFQSQAANPVAPQAANIDSSKNQAFCQIPTNLGVPPHITPNVMFTSNQQLPSTNGQVAQMHQQQPNYAQYNNHGY